MTRPSVTSVHAAIKAALITAGVYAVDGPAAVADAVEAAVGGLRLSGGDVLRQSLVTQPSPEPNADPRRVSLAVEYTTITKG